MNFYAVRTDISERENTYKESCELLGIYELIGF